MRSLRHSAAVTPSKSKGYCLRMMPCLKCISDAFLPALALRTCVRVLADGAFLNSHRDHVASRRVVDAVRPAATVPAGLHRASHINWDERLALAVDAAHRACVEAHGYGRDQPSVAVEIGPETTASKAARRDCGRDLPRFSARRRIPAQAVGLK